MDDTAQMIAGVDEAGRGPLAGPVVAAAVILNPAQRIYKLTDSKLLTPLERERFYEKIISRCLAFAVGIATVTEIDTINILQASLLAMRRAVAGLSLLPDCVWVDGNQDPKMDVPTKLFVGGDLLMPCISAASIVAKVTRDRLMVDLDKEIPGYGLAQHKGYATQEHLTALKKLGPSVHHRRSFAPCAV